jgi:flagellar hook-length control protein FliK
MAAALRAASNATAVQVERSVTVPVHERHWPTALAAQVLVLSNDKVQGATLRLSPEHLGPVEVRIDMHEANVNVSFTAAHTETRAALEQAMPQLRAVLAGAGLSLGQATVQQQARRESQNPNLPARIGGAADEQIEAPAALARALGLIDEYV